MTTEEQRKTFAKGFVAFVSIALDRNAMKASSFAAMLAITLGRFIHDFVPRAGRQRLAVLCAQSLVKVAVEDGDEKGAQLGDYAADVAVIEDDEPESMH